MPGLDNNKTKRAFKKDHDNINWWGEQYEYQVFTELSWDTYMAMGSWNEFFFFFFSSSSLLFFFPTHLFLL